MINSITEEILKHVKKSDYQKGSQYDEDYIQYIGVTKVDKNKRHQFLVESESSYRKYMVQVEMCQNKIESTYCTCPQFEIADSCKHVAACCILYSDKLFSFLNEQDIEYKSQYILKKINDQLKKSYQKKQEVFLTPMLAIEDGYYRNYVSLKVKIGIGKKYSFLGKYSGFMSAYQYHEPFTFGSSFTFDPDEHYFSEQSLRLLDLIDQIRKYSRINGNTAYLNERNIKDLFHIYPDGITSASSEAFMPLIQDFPVQVNFSKKDSKYKMIFPDDLGDIFPLTSDLEYVLYQQKIYRLNPQQQLFLRECMESDLQELIFPESQFSEFQKTVIRTLKDHLVLDESTNALPSIQGIAFNIVLDREVNGIWKLPDNARIVAAGNDMKDSLAANQLAEPLFNRFAHVYIKTTAESWLKWASEHNIHPAIYSYIAYKKGETLRSKYDGEKPNADPRKWEMASKMLYATGSPEMLRALVGEDITREFVQFCNQQVITLDDVINENYTQRDIQALNTAERYATTMGLSQVDDNNLEKVKGFVTGLGAEFGAIFDALWTHGDESKLERLAEVKLAEMSEGGIRR